MRQLGPGMIQQMTSPCGCCRGAGRVIPEGSQCGACGGRKVAKEKKLLEVHIEPGMKHGEWARICPVTVLQDWRASFNQLASSITNKLSPFPPHRARSSCAGTKIRFAGEAGNQPGSEPGDVVFVLQAKEHPVFKRDGHDLFIDKDLPLVGACTQFMSISG